MNRIELSTILTNVVMKFTKNFQVIVVFICIYPRFMLAIEVSALENK